MWQGQRRKFSTGETALSSARRKAAVIMADIRSRGFDEAKNIHSRRDDERPANPTIEEFADLYREAMSKTENAPSKPTVEYYVRCLKTVCSKCGVTRLNDFARADVDLFVKNYQKKALAAGRNPESVKTSINSYLRNAAAMFSMNALEGYARMGLHVKNPFVGARLRRVRIKGYSPLSPARLDNLWEASVHLRDGNPEAKTPIKKGRWSTDDFSKPHPEAFALLLLELGLGLRRHEADKAEWDWILSDGAERYYLEVKPTDFFIPKGKERRVIPMPKNIYDALLALKDDERFIVAGREPKTYKPGTEPKNLTYRCERHHRSLAKWLREQGLTDAKPCHQLRKEFGSYVATSFGLYHAQKFLGHSSPVVTDAYYAALNNLPVLVSMPSLKS
jgi:integrase